MSLSLGNVKLKCPARSIQSRPTTEKSSLPGNQIVVWIAGTLFKIQAVKKQILYLCLKVYVITRGEIHQFSSYDWMHWFICRVNRMALCRDHCPAPFSYIVWQKGYFHLFPLTVGILYPLAVLWHSIDIVDLYIYISDTKDIAYPLTFLNYLKVRS